MLPDTENDGSTHYGVLAHEGGSMSTLSRPRHGRMIAGVCAGLAVRFDRSPALVRTLFILSLLLPGPQVLVYLALWVIMPNEG
jgi:phage shock protein PspC (stress-responsive transcriptional regulator)